MANRGYVRYSGNVRVELEWVAGVAPSPGEKPGAYRVYISADRVEGESPRITHIREAVGRPFYLYGDPEVTKLSDIDVLAERAIDLALADEEMRDKLAPKFSTDGRHVVVHPFPSELRTSAPDAGRDLIECARTIRGAMPVGPFTSSKGVAVLVERAAVDAAAHLKNKLAPAIPELAPLSAGARAMRDAAVKTLYPGERIPDPMWELVQHGLGVARNEKWGDEYAWRFVPKGGV